MITSQVGRGREGRFCRLGYIRIGGFLSGVERGRTFKLVLREERYYCTETRKNIKFSRVVLPLRIRLKGETGGTFSLCGSDDGE